jgi:hypothetical protein
MKYPINGVVLDSTTGRPIEGARVEIQCKPPDKDRSRDKQTIVTYSNERGRFSAEVEDDCQPSAFATAFDIKGPSVTIQKDCGETLPRVDVDKKITFSITKAKDCGPQAESCQSTIVGTRYTATVQLLPNTRLEFTHGPGADVVEIAPGVADFMPLVPGKHDLGGILSEEHIAGIDIKAKYHWFTPIKISAGQPPQVNRIALQRSAVRPTQEEDLWTLIRANSRALRFESYREFINRVLCVSPVRAENLRNIPEGRRLERERSELSSTFGVGAYELLRTATDLFLLLHCRTRGHRAMHGDEFIIEEEYRRQRATPRDLTAIANQFLGHNAYIEHVVRAAFPDDRPLFNEEVPGGIAFCDGVLVRDEPCLIELIWSYWHEEAMLAQSVNALTRRFQNRAAKAVRDPLAHFELDPLRPLNNVMWGYVQEEYRRLTVPRRSLEYSHHYGLTLFGKANPNARSADPRSNFLESFHNLLHRCYQFFKEDNDTTVIADGFPLLNALKEVHLILSQGAANQFGDLPWTARGEMLIQQWIMARPETRDFLQSRAMVRYTEAWMPQVDTMKTIQGWTDITVERFHDLAAYGEEILLSIRYGDWVNINDEDVAKNWARYWRPEIQSYLHSYRAVAGVDLTSADVDHTIPAVHLQRRLDAQARAR